GSLIRGSYVDVDPYTFTTSKQVLCSYHDVTLKNNTALIAEVFGNDNVFTSMSNTGTKQDSHRVSIFDRNGEFNKSKTYIDIFNNNYNRSSFIDKIRNQNILTVMYRNIDLEIDDGL